MEIVAHALWATAAGRAANRRMAKLGIVWFAVWALVPDLFAFAPEVIVGLWRRVTGPPTGGGLDFHHVDAQWGWLNVDRYDIGHSLVVFAAVFLMVWAILRRPLWELLGWALHILLDIPSHSAHYPTPFLWPIFSYYIAGVSWRQWWFTALNYGILAALFLALRMDRIKRRHALATLPQTCTLCGGSRPFWVKRHEPD